MNKNLYARNIQVLYTPLNYKLLQYRRLGLHSEEYFDKPGDLSKPYLERRLRNASAIALRVELRRRETINHERIRKLRMTRDEQLQVLEYMERRARVDEEWHKTVESRVRLEQEKLNFLKHQESIGSKPSHPRRVRFAET